METAIIRIDLFWADEKFMGELCGACNQCIYGDGARAVVSQYNDANLLPKITETNIILCQACKILIND